MSILPVLERELRVAARERNTYRVRFLAALLTILFSAFSLWFVTILGARPIPGRDLYMILTWMTFAIVILTGIASTSDCISEEKREATLGLLFLTDLKGADVVLGKLFASGLRGVYSLIGTLPVLAIPVLMGGSNATEFARTILALLVTLFLSLCLGIGVSVFCRKAWTSMGISATAAIFFVGALPALSELMRDYYQQPTSAHCLEVASPSYALIMSFRTAWGMPSNDYWLSISLLFNFALLLLALAAFVTPRIWQDRPPRQRLAALLQFWRDLRLGSAPFRTAFRRRLFAINPIFWLAGREKISCRGMMLFIAACGLTVLWLTWTNWGIRAPQAQLVFPFLCWGFCVAAVHLALVVRIAVAAAERFGEDRRSGALELILSTPLQIKEVLRGQWFALGRQFAGPALCVLLIHSLVIAWFLNIQSFFGQEPDSLRGLARNLYNHFLGGGINGAEEPHIILLIMLGLIPFALLEWITLAWTSMWLALRTKKLLSAPISTVILVHAPPFFAFLAIVALIEYLRLTPNDDLTHGLLYLAIATLLLLLNHALLIAWSRRNLYRHFRTAATDRYQPAPKHRWWQLRIA